MAENVTTTALPELVTIRDVPLVETGTWQAMTGEVTFTAEDLAAAVAALDDPAVRTPVLKLGHDGPLTSDQPTVGKVENLRLSDDGQKIIGDLVGVPRWLAAILPTAYPRRSIEGTFQVKTATGREHRFVLTALSLLGASLPAVETLDDLRALYTADGMPEWVEAGVEVQATMGATMADRRVSAALEVEDVRRAYYDAIDRDPAKAWWWIRAIRLDPQDLIVDDDEGHLFRVPWTVADGGVEFGDPVAVRVEYVDEEGQGVAAGTRVAAAYASRAESRPTRPAGGSMDPREIRERLGLAETATDDEVLARIDELAVTDPNAADSGDDGDAQGDAGAGERQTTAEPVAAGSGDAPTVTVDRDTWEQVRAGAEAGQEAARRIAREDRERRVDDAVRTGRIAPARRDAWLRRLEADPEEASVLASLEPGLIPVDERGTSIDDNSGNDERELALVRAAHGIKGA